MHKYCSKGITTSQCISKMVPMNKSSCYGCFRGGSRGRGIGEGGSSPHFPTRGHKPPPQLLKICAVTQQKGYPTEDMHGAASEADANIPVPDIT